VPPIRPATDDLNAANDVTAKGRNGATRRATRDTGPMNTADPLDDPEGIGRQEQPIDANPVDGDRLADIAGWALHLGTWPGARYRSVTVDLNANPDLVADVQAMLPGDIITIDDLDADQVELMAMGATDVVGSHTRRVTFNCRPAGPFRVPAVDVTGYMRVGSSTSTLAADFDAGTDTSMSVAVTGVLWDTTLAPFHVRVGGVVLNVTAISGASSPQTFTVDAAPVNGVERLISASGPAALTRVNIADPVFIGA
jgi:hypothetical protein